ncbi:hypothetical protein Bbelb_317110 [Branchiostoma belcheri]|nr:hypothetical protein Bbelb_317110 [Branchiostoma belcheri]
MSATEKKLPPDGGYKKGAPVDISRLSTGRLHPVPDECLGYEEESVYDYGIPEDVRGYEEDGSVHDKPRGAGGKKTPGEEESFAYKAKGTSAHSQIRDQSVLLQSQEVAKQY